MKARSITSALIIVILALAMAGASFAEPLAFPLAGADGVPLQVPALSGRYSSVLAVDMETGAELFALDSGAEFSPTGAAVSLMTAYIAANELSLDETVVVGDAEDEFPDGGRAIGLDSDSAMSVGELVAAMMLYGAQDAATVLASRIDGDIDAFVDRMNAQAQTLGMAGTEYNNAYGGYNRHQCTTTADTMTLMLAAMQNEALAGILTQGEYTFLSANADVPATINSRIEMMQPESPTYDERVFGIGIGMTSSGGTNVLLCARENGHTALILLYSDRNDGDYAGDAKAVIDYCFLRYAAADELALAEELARREAELSEAEAKKAEADASASEPTEAGEPTVEPVATDFPIYTSADWQPETDDSLLGTYGWVLYIIAAAFFAVVVLLVAYFARRRR